MPQSAADSPAIDAQPPTGIEFAAMPAADDEVAAEINARLTAPRWSRLLIVVAVAGGILAFVKGFTIVGLVACVGFIVWAVIRSGREAQERRIESELNYGIQSLVAADASSAVMHVNTPLEL